MSSCRRVIVIFSVIVAACIVIGIVMLMNNDQSEGGVAMAFLTALLDQNADVADSYLSENLSAIAQEQCANATIIGCSLDLVSTWGSVNDIKFVIGSQSRNTVLFHTFWSNAEKPISIVIVMTRQNDEWLVEGWRGFVSSSSENDDAALLRGTRLDNAFPAN